MKVLLFFFSLFDLVRTFDTAFASVVPCPEGFEKFAHATAVRLKLVTLDGLAKDLSNQGTPHETRHDLGGPVLRIVPAPAREGETELTALARHLDDRGTDVVGDPETLNKSNITASFRSGDHRKPAIVFPDRETLQDGQVGAATKHEAGDPNQPHRISHAATWWKLQLAHQDSLYHLLLRSSLSVTEAMARREQDIEDLYKGHQTGDEVPSRVVLLEEAVDALDHFSREHPGDAKTHEIAKAVVNISKDMAALSADIRERVNAAKEEFAKFYDRQASLKGLRGLGNQFLNAFISRRQEETGIQYVSFASDILRAHPKGSPQDTKIVQVEVVMDDFRVLSFPLFDSQVFEWMKLQGVPEWEESEEPRKLYVSFPLRFERVAGRTTLDLQKANVEHARRKLMDLVAERMWAYEAKFSKLTDLSSKIGELTTQMMEGDEATNVLPKIRELMKALDEEASDDRTPEQKRQQVKLAG